MNKKLALASSFVSILTFVVGLYIFYSGSAEIAKSGFAALLSSMLVFLACYTIGWFFQVFEG